MVRAPSAKLHKPRLAIKPTHTYLDGNEAFMDCFVRSWDLRIARRPCPYTERLRLVWA